MTTPPIVTLLQLRTILRNAERRGQKLDPAFLLAIIDGKVKA